MRAIANINCLSANLVKLCSVELCWCSALHYVAHNTGLYTMLMSCCAYSCTQYGLHTQYMLLTNADVLLCLQLHTVRSPYTVHVSNQSRWLAVPSAALCEFSTFFYKFKVFFWTNFIHFIHFAKVYISLYSLSLSKCNIASHLQILNSHNWIQSVCNEISSTERLWSSDQSF